MKKHDLKIDKQYFEVVITQKKRFEVRKNDRNYQINDILYLKEYDKEKEEYTGRYTIAKILYILNDDSFLKEGYVVLSISIIKTDNKIN